MKPCLLEVLGALAAGQCEITFVKVNGELTTRLATCNRKLIPAHLLPARDAMMKRIPDDCVPFFSITDNGWRSFKVTNLVDFEKVESTFSKHIWITEWNSEAVKIVDRLGQYAPAWIPRQVISEMELLEYNADRKVYVYRAQIEKAWWAKNIRIFDHSVTGYSFERRGIRSDD